MQPIWCNVAALAVALIFYTWRTHRQLLARRQRLLRERVAYMLWALADHVGDQPPSRTTKSLTPLQS